ncbi:glutathione S-transferase family protein [Frigidibacter sp. ROC022]|uniref:glutathione S-transferase family protein n=1 Tax=Frigidibacter sp. ROC022 TaxID=2971796 RepID=UPI00215A5CE6|nr:glutathione S-transferase [Frigidibacter sp. ROC022]MCR8723143.1 glutathione binding-like protein [Frigidibacter sp. ROC022]
MTNVLHCFGESGNAYKAALTLTLCGIDWTPRKVDFFNGATRTPEFRARNVMGEVPVLETGDGEVITQSGVIQQWAAEQSGRLGGETPAERREVLRWQFWDNHKLSSQAGMLRFLMNFLPPEKRPAEVIEFTKGRLQAAYKTLDTALENSDFLVGRSVTLADTACCGYLYYPEPFGFSRADWPNIDRWLSNLQALEGWKHPYDMMPGSPADRA